MDIAWTINALAEGLGQADLDADHFEALDLPNVPTGAMWLEAGG